MARVRLILMVLLAAAVSLAAGLAVNWLTDLIPCQGEGLACNIDVAIGGYGSMIWAGLGAVVFAMTLLIARTRKALAGAACVLLLPLIVLFLLTKIDTWRYVGFDPYPSFRSFLTMLAPPACAVVVQYLILRLAVPAASSVHRG